MELLYPILVALLCLNEVDPVPLLPIRTEQSNVLEDYALPISLADYTIFPNFLYFDTTYVNLFIVDNGAITFESGFTGGEPTMYTSANLWIAPFGDDVGGDYGQVYYGADDTTEHLQTISGYIQAIYPAYNTFQATRMFVVTWEEVRPFPATTSTLKNTFQAVLATDGTWSFVLFLYDTLQWGDATVGVSGGTSTEVHTVCGSGTRTVQTLPGRAQVDCGLHEGVLAFRVDKPGLMTGSCVPLYSTSVCGVAEQMRQRQQRRCARRP